MRHSDPFSTQLRTWRKAVGLKQDALAYMLGVTQGAVSHWETGQDRPSRSLMLRLQEMMAVSGEGRLRVDAFAISRMQTLQASFDLDGVRLIGGSAGVHAAWPQFADIQGKFLQDLLVDEAAQLMHDDDFVRSVRRGEVALVSAVSSKQLSVSMDNIFLHRWIATFRNYGTRMIINMTYEACQPDASVGVEQVLLLDELGDI